VTVDSELRAIWRKDIAKLTEAITTLGQTVFKEQIAVERDLDAIQQLLLQAQDHSEVRPVTMADVPTPPP
jgi:hypothetical protein